jgi:acetyl-CoA synthetase
MTHSAVLECAVTGVPDEIRGQAIKATIVLSPQYSMINKDTLAKEIQEHVKNVTAAYKYPRIIDFVNELPKTISGKIRRVEIREQPNSTIPC